MKALWIRLKTEPQTRLGRFVFHTAWLVFWLVATGLYAWLCGWRAVLIVAGAILAGAVAGVLFARSQR